MDVRAGSAFQRAGRGGATWARLLAAALSLAVMSVLVLTGSRAAFTESTANAGNSWETGGITLTDDAPDGDAMFEVSGMEPGQSDVRCIAVTYDGAYAADVKLYASVGGDLAQYLDIAVEIGDGAGFGADCVLTGATALEPPSTLQAFGVAHGAWGNGLEAFSAPVGQTTKTFRFTVTLQSTTDAQNKGATAVFTWEAQTA